jgi:Flp pilus assembly protein protease CpaA
MLGWVSLVVGMVGFGLAGYWDLKYTEFPDWLPYSIIASALILRTAFSFITGDFSLLISSLTVGCTFLAIGLGLYLAKQWGDGDAWLLGGMGFLFPDAAGFGVTTFFPFPIAMLFNFLFASLFYLIAYSLVLGYRDRKVRKGFAEDLRKNWKTLFLFSLLFFGAAWGSVAYFSMAMSVPLEALGTMIFLPFLLVSVLIFTRYARAIERHSFRRRISSRDLRPGDVILKKRWKGLKPEEVKNLRKSSRYVWIKEGVRFAPVFIITILISLFIGDLIVLFV